MKVKAIPINEGQKGEFYILINSREGDVLRAPNHWKTKRGAERWAEKNGLSVADKPVAKKAPARAPKKAAAKKPAAKKPVAKKAPARAPKKTAAKKPMTRLPSSIGFIEKNAYGAYVVHGDIGTRRYMGYTKKEAIARYNSEAKKK